MHSTAFEIGREFFHIYCDRPSARVLDIGARNFNGTLRDCAPAGIDYVGVDLEAGDGVDLVLDDPCLLPFEEGTFDAVVSTSCFEHNQMFWLAFTEMVRVVKQGGYVYINAPSNGTYHAYPYDNWRFYPDASLALVAWAKRQGVEVTLIESFVARKKAVWSDCVMVFQKPIGGTATPPERLLCDVFSDAFNIRTHGSDTVQNFSELPEDALIARSLKEANTDLEKTVKAKQRQIEAQQQQIEAQRRQSEALRHQLAAARRDLAQTATSRRELDGALQTVQRMKASISWRLTKPLRLVIRALRNTRQRLRG